MKNTEEFDFIVIGAGSAGVPIAARLSESGKHTVLLLEAGPPRHPFWVKVPMGYVFFLDRKSSYNWGFETEPEPNLANRVIKAPRGRGLGGTSLINSMLYVRGAPFDYDGWKAQGAEGWGYDDVLPFFKKAESHEKGPSEFHGIDGPLNVRGPQSESPIHNVMVDAGVELGFGTTEDFNGATYEGFGRYHHNQFLKNGQRCSTGAAYLGTGHSRANLKITYAAHVTKIDIKENRAVGVYYAQHGESFQAKCRREVVLSAGAFQSPQVLMHSGIGAASELQRFGIDVVLNQPNVGQNLMDHYGADIQCTASKPVTLYSSMKIPGALTALYRLLFKGTGPYTFFPFDSGAMIKSHNGAPRPDTQLLCGDYTRENGRKTMSRHGFNIAWCQSVPSSRGSVKLKSSDPADQPKISYNFLATEDDRLAQRRAFKIVRALLSTNAFSKFMGEEISPGLSCQTDADIDDYVASNGGQHHHPCGTVRMGTAAQGVVDHRLRVHGVSCLRVADASIMPTIVSGNTNAPTIMIGEKAASMILADAV
ncbi:MAG: GMC family oxidoreductase N-terminal domain-containing protein [Pseudomonadota bacterium]